MKPKYLEPDSRSQDRWMISYLDVLTILLIFFISAAIRTQEAAGAPAAAPRPARPAATSLADLQKRLADGGLDVHREQRGVVISIPQMVLFASGDDRVSGNAIPIVEKIASAIRDLPNPVTLVGHADAVPIHNRRFRNNWELSAGRGLRLLELLSREYGIAETRLSVLSEGANRPASSNKTDGGRASNRRVEIVIAGE
jgi:chemotaxis protein MotB